MRHAESDEALIGNSDFARVLNKAGRQQAMHTAIKLRALDLKIAQALVSAAHRTRESYEILLTKLTHKPEVFYDKKLYNNTYEEILQIILEHAYACESIIFVGHNPTLGNILYYLTGENYMFKPASLVVLRGKKENLVESLIASQGFYVEVILS